ncbi:hypothetical protein NLJ89_g11319 [Agrocybe chaxingu]|uniref:Uncharacterized protein n=1 Tax=Agrocybe chaxingu TaxID=84603 RepID=A0A9W8MRR3_9AGAR|nr:hypothetical protein NLJ89_g11319 [Agrocybe chaxingu]
MKFLSLIALVFAAVAHTALGIPQVNVPSASDVVGGVEAAVPMEALNGTAVEDANHLRKMCEDGGPNAADQRIFHNCMQFIAIKYEGGEEVVCSYDTCIPKTLNGNRDVLGVFCKSATCYGYSNRNCTGQMSEGILFVEDTPYPAETVNPAVKLLLNRESVTCQPPLGRTV